MKLETVSNRGVIMKQLPNEVKPSNVFLDHFPESRRSSVMNCFLAPVRQGECSPEMVVNRVWAEATARARLCGADERTKHLGLCLAVENHPAEAASLVAYCLWWESLSPGEKAQLKAEASERHRAEWMRQHPATQKQVMFLRQLGHRGPVGDRQEASDEITRRLAGARHG